MFLTRAEARALDRRAMDECGIPGIVLMENAGRGIAELLRSLGVSGRVGVCCGKGNNGGDGFVVARHLSNAGVEVRILLFAKPDELTGDAAVAHGMLRCCGIREEVFAAPELDEEKLRGELTSAEWVVDGLFGSGLEGAVRPPSDRVIEAMNACPARVLAIDIPSGLDSDTGLPLGVAVRAHHTATVIAPKAGFAQQAAQAYLGQVHVIDMGAPRSLLERSPA
jgi:NAD(P)H-hydrate epimerase